VTARSVAQETALQIGGYPAFEADLPRFGGAGRRIHGLPAEQPGAFPQADLEVQCASPHFGGIGQGRPRLASEAQACDGERRHERAAIHHLLFPQ